MNHPGRRTVRWLLAALAGMLLIASWTNPVGAQTASNSTAVTIDVTAEIVESGADVSVAATDPALNALGQWEHAVRVTWNGTGTVPLDDARFAHHLVTADGNLVTAGRGCAPNDGSNGAVFIACTADLQLVDLAPGEAHDYPVRVYPGFASLALGGGTYVVEETIGWEPVAGGGREEVTVRLTYVVTDQPSSLAGVLTPEPAASGVTLATWSGGPVEQLPAARSYWVTVDGSFRSYAPDAPAL